MDAVKKQQSEFLTKWASKCKETNRADYPVMLMPNQAGELAIIGIDSDEGNFIPVSREDRKEWEQFFRLLVRKGDIICERHNTYIFASDAIIESYAHSENPLNN